MPWFTRCPKLQKGFTNIYNRMLSIFINGSDVRNWVIVFLYILKAVDRVYHDGFIHKLKSFGISGNLLAWFRNYLKQRVLLNGKISKLPINDGVSQGSILGPVLFFIFINDLPDEIPNDTFTFGIDTSLMRIFDVTWRHCLTCALVTLGREV